jgi:hypothetical protein
MEVRVMKPGSKALFAFVVDPFSVLKFEKKMHYHLYALWFGG